MNKIVHLTLLSMIKTDEITIFNQFDNFFDNIGPNFPQRINSIETNMWVLIWKNNSMFIALLLNRAKNYRVLQK